MKKIKVLEVMADSSLSGASKHLLTLAKNLDKGSFEVIIICPQGWLAEEAARLGIKIILVPMKGFFDLVSVKNLKKIIKKVNPDLIHLHGIRAGWLGTLAARQHRQKIIYSEHLYTQDYHLESRTREWLQLYGLSHILKKVRMIIVPSKAVRSFLCQKFRIKKNRIKLVYNGLEDISLSFRRAESRRRDKRGEILGGLSSRLGGTRDDQPFPRKELVGFIGSLNRQKGIETLIKAFKIVNRSYPKIKLEIIGKGPLEYELKRKANKISNNILFLGAKNDIFHYIDKWQMLILPSISESFGQTAAEAAIMSKPVVATKVGGLPEVVKDKITGLLVEPNNPKSLARAINYLLDHPDEAREMGRRGRLRYEKLFTAERMVYKMEKIYRQISNVKS